MGLRGGIYEKANLQAAGNVVDLVRELGSDAIEQFLDGLRPHLDAIQKEEVEAPENLGKYLDQWVLTAVVIQDAGGVEAFEEQFAQARAEGAAGPSMSAEEAIAEFKQRLNLE